MKRYKVLVVDDSAFMRKIVSDMIGAEPNFEVVHTAKNGREAVEKAKSLQPDVITMDVEMPEMNGLEALQHIMKENPIPVIMLSNLTSDGAEITIRSLEMGAIDFVQKPSGAISLDLNKVQATLVEKLNIAVQSRPITHPASVDLRRSRETNSLSSSSDSFQKIVAIGTSTGGPRALQQVMREIPHDFPAPIVIVQHMPPKFTRSLAQRLNSCSTIQVVEAEHNQRLATGTAYIAPGGYHMIVEEESGHQYKIKLTSEEPRMGHRPSVDRLFESLLPCTRLERYAVIMTGMGSDGAKGMKALKESGALATIAESEETCVVYGMPRSAVELKGVDYILPLHQIAPKLVELVSRKPT